MTEADVELLGLMSLVGVACFLMSAVCSEIGVSWLGWEEVGVAWWLGGGVSLGIEDTCINAQMDTLWLKDRLFQHFKYRGGLI